MKVVGLMILILLGFATSVWFGFDLEVKKGSTEGRVNQSQSSLQWALQKENDQLNIKYELRNPEPIKIYFCKPDPPYVEVRNDRNVRIWLGMYVLGERDIVETPIVPEVLPLEVGQTYRGSIKLELPLDEIHPFPKHEHDKKIILESKEIFLEIGYFPFDDKHIPPSVPGKSGEVLVAPYGWAFRAMRYVKSQPVKLSIPIKLPKKWFVDDEKADSTTN